jgi:hypothetical protein
MYTVKVPAKGKKVVFRAKEVRTPAVFHNVTEKELKLLEVMLRAVDTEFELIEVNSKHLQKLAQKLNKNGIMNYQVQDGVVKYCFKDVDLEETKVEEVEIDDLFDSDDTMGKLLKNLDKE